MSILIDSHVHFYPSYDPARFFGAFRDAMRRAGARQGAIMLAEREGADFFGAWSRQEGLPKGWTVSRREEAAILLRPPDGRGDVAVVAGRQIACAERVEILALGTRASFREGVPAADAVAAARDADALPVLAWGVGKWLFSRAAVVESLMRRFPGPELALGHPSMRPVFWPAPSAMLREPTLGRRVLHGSDPLPRAGEDCRPGQWADLADEPFYRSVPLLSRILSILRETPLSAVGRRAGVFQFARRMF